MVLMGLDFRGLLSLFQSRFQSGFCGRISRFCVLYNGFRLNFLIFEISFILSFERLFFLFRLLEIGRKRRGVFTVFLGFTDGGSGRFFPFSKA